MGTRGAGHSAAIVAAASRWSGTCRHSVPGGFKGREEEGTAARTSTCLTLGMPWEGIQAAEPSPPASPPHPHLPTLPPRFPAPRSGLRLCPRENTLPHAPGQTGATQQHLTHHRGRTGPRRPAGPDSPCHVGPGWPGALQRPGAVSSDPISAALPPVSFPTRRLAAPICRSQSNA